MDSLEAQLAQKDKEEERADRERMEGHMLTNERRAITAGGDNGNDTKVMSL